MPRVPEEIRSQLMDLLWERADELNWLTLSNGRKAHYYERWSREEAIVNSLSGFVRPADVRVYIKDSLLKGYARAKTSDSGRVIRVFGLAGIPIEEEDIKPHSIKLEDGRIFAWGNARDWRNVLMAVFERSYRGGGKPAGALFLNAVGQFKQPEERRLIEQASQLLRIERVEWVDTY